MTLAVRYANGGNTDRMFNAYLDHDYLVSAPPTGAWDKWDTAYVVMDAPQGETELKIMSLTSDGAPNIDAFGFSLAGVCRVGEECPEVQDTTDTTMVLRGIAANADVRLRGAVLSLVRDADVSVFDMRGRLVVRKTASAGEMNLSETVRTAGLYRVVVRSGSEKLVATWAKVR